MVAAADEEQLKIVQQDDQFSDKKFFNQVGLDDTQLRIKHLDRQLDKIWGDRSRPRSSGGQSSARSPRKGHDVWGGHASSSEPASARSRDGGDHAAREINRHNLSAQRTEQDKEEAKKELRRRVRREREQLNDEWKEHQDRDEKDIKRLTEDCISKSVKRSLKKMRQNLFQRRINLAIHDRLTNEWTLPKIQGEVRNARIQKEKSDRIKAQEAARVAGEDAEE